MVKSHSLGCLLVVMLALSISVGCGAGYMSISGGVPYSAPLDPNNDPTPDPSPTSEPTPTPSTSGTPTPTGTGTPMPSPTDTASPCPPLAGNMYGVGTPCSKGGGQCNNLPAKYCGAELSNASEEAYCTLLCQDSAACGPGASCLPDPRNTLVYLCVADACSTAQQRAQTRPTPLTNCLGGGANNVGVGKACTRGGRQCGFPSVCTADASASTPLSFCTRLCSSDANCGTSAVCVTDPSSGRKACAPRSCLP